MKPSNYFHRMLGCIVIGSLLILLIHKPVIAISSIDANSPLKDAALHLVRFCTEPKTDLDEHAVATIVDYVLSPKQTKEYSLPKLLDATGAYYEFDMKVAFPRYIEYSYNPNIPTSVTRPSSVRYSVWASPKGDIQRLPNTWKPVLAAGAPIVIRSMQREADTPDLNTGVYHEYDLKRTLIHLNYKGRQVLISISKQINKSDVGKKGVILGDDNDWTYYYSGEPGTPKTGLGWVKSYIYDYFSVGVYAESGTSQNMVKIGVFQWLRAGWSGINFVQPNHILGGMKRFARNHRMILESPRLPASERMISVYQWLLNMPTADLLKKYTTLQRALRSSAIQIGKINKSDDENPSSTNAPKEQMVEELMLEYLKTNLGKPTVVGQTLSPASNP